MQRPHSPAVDIRLTSEGAAVVPVLPQAEALAGTWAQGYRQRPAFLQKASKSSIGIGRANRNPCPKSQPAACRMLR